MNRLDLSTYGDELNDTYKQILQDKSDIDWILFGFHKSDNSLKVMDTGSKFNFPFISYFILR